MQTIVQFSGYCIEPDDTHSYGAYLTQIGLYELLKPDS